MKNPVYVCSRCGAPTRSHSTIEATGGPVRAAIWTPIPICTDCTERFLDWLRGGRHQDHGGIGAALAPTVVASGLAKTG